MVTGGENVGTEGEKTHMQLPVARANAMMQEATAKIEEINRKVEETKKAVAQVNENLDQKVGEANQSIEDIRNILAKKGFYNWIVAALAILGGILTLGLVVLLGMDKPVPEGYIAIITAVVGALAGSMIPQGK